MNYPGIVLDDAIQRERIGRLMKNSVAELIRDFGVAQVSQISEDEIVRRAFIFTHVGAYLLALASRRHVPLAELPELGVQASEAAFAAALKVLSPKTLIIQTDLEHPA